jgi:hypothetical protein
MSENETFTEVTEESWFDRLRSAIKGVATGLLFLVIALPLLFWNEGRAVRTARGLEEGAGAVVPVKPDRLDPANEGKLIHATGPATTHETLRDDLFGVSAAGIRLVRQVEMYQWKETRRTTHKKQGSKKVKVTTYDYEKVWSSEPIGSRAFKHEEGHENPARMPYESKTFSAAKVALGAIELPPSLVAKIGGARDLPVTSRMALGMEPRLAARARLVGGGYYIGRWPSRPAVGDLRVRYRVVAPATVSVVARQAGGTLAPFDTSTGSTIELLQMGAVDAPTMFKTAQEGQRTLTWILRGVGLALLFFGLLLVFAPIAVVADFVPVLGDLLQFGVTAFAGALAAVLGALTIGVAWIAYRPLLGIPLLVGAAGLIVGLKLLGHGRSHKGGQQDRPPRAALSNT